MHAIVYMRELSESTNSSSTHIYKCEHMRLLAIGKQCSSQENHSWALCVLHKVESHSVSHADILAISLLFVSCIAIGAMEKMRDFLARLLPWWTEDMALYPHILS